MIAVLMQRLSKKIVWLCGEGFKVYSAVAQRPLKIIILYVLMSLGYTLHAHGYGPSWVVWFSIGVLLLFQSGQRLVAGFSIVLVVLASYAYEQGDRVRAEAYVRTVYYIWICIVLRQYLIMLLTRYTYLHKVTSDICVWLDQMNVAVACFWKNVVRTVSYHRIATILSVILFSIPFFWFRWGEGDFGGDASRLYFYDPLAFLRSVSFSEIGYAAFGVPLPNFFLIPFLLLLLFLKDVILFGSHELLLNAFNGALLSVSFVSVYAVITVSSSEDGDDPSWDRSPAVIGALFFVFSQLVTYHWQRALYSFHQIALYPLLTYFFLCYIRSGRWRYLWYGLTLTIIFSPNFSVYAFPVLIAFFSLVTLFLLLFAFMHGQTRRWVQGIVVFSGIFLCLHAFQLFPQFYDTFQPSRGMYKNIFSDTGKVDRGLNYFEIVRPVVRLAYNLAGFQQYDVYARSVPDAPILSFLSRYGREYLPVALSPLVVIFSALFFLKRTSRERRWYLCLMFLFVVALFLTTANVGGVVGPSLYRTFFSLPGFSMFRSYYAVFSIVYIFFYAVLFGVALTHLSRSFLSRSLRIGLSIFFGSLFLYTALPFIRGDIVNMNMADTKEVKFSNAFSEDLLEMIRDVRSHPEKGALLTTPLTLFNYQVLSGTYGGAYVGPSPFAVIGQTLTYSGLSGFDYSGSILFTHETLIDLVKRKDYETINRLFSFMNIGRIFVNTDPAVYRERFVGWPYSQEVWSIFPELYSFQLFVEALGYTPVKTQGNYVLYENPKQFLPVLYIPEVVLKLKEREGLQSTPSLFQGKPRAVAVITQDTLRQEFFAAIAKQTEHMPSLSFEKKSNDMYRVTIDDMTTAFPLVFSSAYDDGWRLTLVGTQDSVQDHFVANDYANGWLIYPERLLSQRVNGLKRNADGAISAEFTLQYMPHRFFTIGTYVTIATMLFLLSFALWWHRR